MIGKALGKECMKALVYFGDLANELIPTNSHLQPKMVAYIPFLEGIL